MSQVSKMCKDFSHIEGRGQEVKWKVSTAGRGNTMCKNTSTLNMSGKQYFCNSSDDMARPQLHEIMAIGPKCSLSYRSILGL